MKMQWKITPLLGAVLYGSMALFLAVYSIGVAVGAWPQVPSDLTQKNKMTDTLTKACCRVTHIDAATGIVTAKENSTGRTFQFTVKDAGLLSSLTVGEALFANFKTKLVSFDGKTPGGSIIALGPVDGFRGGVKPVGPVDAAKPAGPVDGAKFSSAGTPAACCVITGIDAATGLVTAKVNSTGQSFQFKLSDATLFHSLAVGQAFFANFKTSQVSFDGAHPAGNILNILPAAGTTPIGFSEGSPSPAAPTNTAGATPKVVATGSSSATNAPASAGHPKTEAASVTPGGLAGLKQAGPTINLPAPPQIQNFGVFPGPILGGEKDIGQVVLTGVPPSGVTVQLSSDQPSVASVPAQIQVSGSGPSAGSAVIVVNTSPVAKPTDVTLSAEVAGTSDVRTTKLTVRPPQVSILDCSPGTFTSGTPIACKVRLDGPAPSSVGPGAKGGPRTVAPVTLTAAPNSAMQIQISTNNSEVASVPGGTISVPAGATSEQFQVPTTAYPEPVDVVISASTQGPTPVSAPVRLTAAAIRSFGCGSDGNSSCEIVPGGLNYNIAKIMMTFSGPTPAGFITVSSNSGVANICDSQSYCSPSLAVPQQAGAKSETLSVLANRVAVSTTAMLLAKDPLSGLVKTAELTIDPPTPLAVEFYSQSQPGAQLTSITSINNVLAGGQQVITWVPLSGYEPDSGITFDVKYSATDAAGNPLPGAVSGPAQFTYGPLPQFASPCSAVFLQACFFTTVQPCEVNAPCKVSVTVGPATGTLYVNP